MKNKHFYSYAQNVIAHRNLNRGLVTLFIINKVEFILQSIVIFSSLQYDFVPALTLFLYATVSLIIFIFVLKQRIQEIADNYKENSALDSESELSLFIHESFIEINEAVRKKKEILLRTPVIKRPLDIVDRIINRVGASSSRKNLSFLKTYSEIKVRFFKTNNRFIGINSVNDIPVLLVSRPYYAGAVSYSRLRSILTHEFAHVIQNDSYLMKYTRLLWTTSFKIDAILTILIVLLSQYFNFSSYITLLNIIPHFLFVYWAIANVMKSEYLADEFALIFSGQSFIDFLVDHSKEPAPGIDLFHPNIISRLRRLKKIINKYNYKFELDI